MEIPHLSRLLPAVALVAALMSAGSDARAQQTILFERGGTVFTTDTGSGASVRTLFSVGNEPDTLCAASPDGRRIAWIVRANSASGDNPSGLAGRPAVVYVSDLSGRHRKRLLSTDSLHDRQGRSVVAVGLGEIGGRLEDWEPVSLSWSADSRTIYLSCLSMAGEGGKATFAADAASGLTVVDSQDRWKSIAPAAFIDARGGLLVGAGFSRFSPAGSVPAGSQTSIRYGPLLVMNLSEGTRTPLYSAPAGAPDTALPDYAFVLDPVLSPDGTLVAFSAPNKGLWLVDRKTRTYHRLLDGAVTRPRWTEDGKSLYFLLARPGAANGAAPPTDLYSLSVPDVLPTGDAPLPVHLVLQGIDGFDLVRN